MSQLGDFIAFKAATGLLEERGKEAVIKTVYSKALAELKKPDKDMVNVVREIYEAFTDTEISEKISRMLRAPGTKADVEVVYQSVEGLHEACPDNLGDWYFTGDYPTPGGNRVANRAFVNYFEGNKATRAY